MTLHYCSIHECAVEGYCPECETDLRVAAAQEKHERCVLENKHHSKLGTYTLIFTAAVVCCTVGIFIRLMRGY